MRSTSILRPAKVRRTVLGGLILLIVFALSGIGFYGKVGAGSTNPYASRSSARAAQPDGQEAAAPVQPNVRSFAGGSIAIPTVPNTSGASNPYPSTINVAVSTSATISNVTLNINGFSHTSTSDVDMMLVSPAATTNNLVFWSDVGGGNAVSNINITLDDAAATTMPNTTLVSGSTFKPTNAASEVFVAPAPAESAFTTFAAAFNGTNANGTWSLYAQDDTGGDSGNMTGWSLNLTFGPTLARMSGGSAIVDDNGLVELKWQTSHEVDNLGFNIYREEGGQRTLVNKQIIAGSALVAGPGTAMTAGRNYRWRDTSAKPGQSAQYWIEAKDLNGSTLLSGPFSPTYSPGRLDTQPSSSTLGDLGRNSGSGKLRLQNASVQPAPPGQTAFKLGVKETGYYRVNQADLMTAGFSPSIDPRNLQLFEDGVQRPIIVQGEQKGRLDSGDWIEFYGRGTDSAYSDTHIYQLVAGSEPGLRIGRTKGKGKITGPDSFLSTASLKERSIYFPGFSNGGQEKFFGAVVAREPVERTLKLQHVAKESTSPAALEISMQGVSAGAHSVKARLNGADVGAVKFDGKSPGIGRMEVPQSSLKEGNNSIQLIAEGGDSDVSLVKDIQLSYWHTYTADDNSLQFIAGGQRVTVGGFTNSAIRVLDVTDADKEGVREVSGAVSQDAGGYSITVKAPGGGARTLVAFASDQVRNPASIAADFPSDWRKRANKADLVIFTRADFISALEPLKALRESQGYRVAVVDVADVYDEFSYGNKTPQAIKDFLAHATSSWKVKPRFALFAGDATYDPKNYLGLGDSDIVPTKLIDTHFLETASDDWLVDFNGDGLPEMAVGRLPVRSVAELSAMVSKIVGYDRDAPSGGMLLVADVGDDAFDFKAASAGILGLIPLNLSTHEIDRGATDGATARMQLLDYLNQGQRVVNYFGHGSVDIWKDNLFTTDDASALTNGGRLSLFVSMTCLNAYFQDTVVDSLGEAMLKARNGGAVAAWASSGMCDLGEQATMNREFYRLLFGGGGLTVGEAAMKSKSSVQDKDVRRTWILLGDPTTRLR